MKNDFLNRIQSSLSTYGNAKVSNANIKPATIQEKGVSMIAKIGRFEGMIILIDTNVKTNVCISFVTKEEFQKATCPEDIDILTSVRMNIIKAEELAKAIEVIVFGEPAPSDYNIPVEGLK